MSDEQPPQWRIRTWSEYLGVWQWEIKVLSADGLWADPYGTEYSGTKRTEATAREHAHMLVAHFRNVYSTRRGTRAEGQERIEATLKEEVISA